MKKQIIWIGALVAVFAILGGSMYAYQKQQHQQKTEIEQKKETMAAKQASQQAEKELEQAQRSEIVTMPTKPTTPQDNIERGWNDENARTFVTNVWNANKHREKFPKLKVAETNTLMADEQFKPYFTKPYWAVSLEQTDKPQQAFLKNNGNHTVTMILTNGTTASPVHEYLIESATYQVIKDKAVDVAASITTWTEF